MGFPEFLGEQREHGERPLEEHRVLQDASSSDTLQVFAGLQEEEPRGVRVLPEQFDDKQQPEEKPFDHQLHTAAVRTSEKPGKHLQSDAKRLQLRVRVYGQLARGCTRPAENTGAEEVQDGLRRLGQRFGSE